MTNQDIMTEDSCRACDGKKGRLEKDDRNGRYVDVWESCDFCRGTGRQTVRVDAVQQ